MGTSERDEWLRAVWRVLVAGESGADRLVFVDEMGANTLLSPLSAWPRRGERARAKAPRNRGKNTTLSTSMSSEGMGATLEVQGGTTKEVFEVSRGAGLGALLEARAGGGDGQPKRPQGR